MRRTGSKVAGRGWRSARHHSRLSRKRAARGCAVAFALVGLDAAAAERHRQRQRPGLQHSRAQARPACAAPLSRRNEVLRLACRTVYRLAARSRLNNSSRLLF